MEIVSSFEAPASLQDAWELLMDVPRITPCMPGAQFREQLGDEAWAIDVSVKLGPMSMRYDTELTRVSADREAGKVGLRVVAHEQRGRGDAEAEVESRLTALGPDLTRVDVTTQLALSGSVAQFGGGIVESVSRQLVTEFADALRHELSPVAAPATPGGPSAPAVAPPRARPVSGLRLLWNALREQALRRFKRKDATRA